MEKFVRRKKTGNGKDNSISMISVALNVIKAKRIDEKDLLIISSAPNSHMCKSRESFEEVKKKTQDLG